MQVVPRGGHARAPCEFRVGGPGGRALRRIPGLRWVRLGGQLQGLSISVARCRSWLVVHRMPNRTAMAQGRPDMWGDRTDQVARKPPDNWSHMIGQLGGRHASRTRSEQRAEPFKRRLQGVGKAESQQSRRLWGRRGRSLYLSGAGRGSFPPPWPDVGPTEPETWPNSSRLWRDRLSWVEIGPIAIDVGRIRPNSAQTCPTQVQCLFTSAQFWSTPAEFLSTSAMFAECGPNSGKLCRNSAEVGQISPKPAQTRSTPAQIWSKPVGRVRPKEGQGQQWITVSRSQPILFGRPRAISQLLIFVLTSRRDR